MLDDLTRDLLDPATPFTLAKLQTLERHITNIYSNEVSRVTESNLILTQLKQQDSIIINIQTLLEHATLDRTKFYVLVTFGQRLEAIWPGLNPAYRQSLRQYFVGLFMKFTRVSLNSETRPISKTVTSIMVKMFLIGYE
jgi:type VI protein secretion system component VasK